MGTHYNARYSNCRTAKELITKFPMLYGQDNYYMLYPDGTTTNRQLVYCDMTTDGGGWMMIARTHPSGTATNWGWTAGPQGDVRTFTNSYQAGWYTYWHANSLTFTEFIYGNRLNVNNNRWGPFVYKKSAFTYSNLITSDTQQTATATVLKSDVSVFNLASAPSMQTAIGFPTTGTTNKNYYLRDCCGYSAYGIMPDRLNTTYINDPTLWYYAGPFGAGDAYDGSGNFTQTTGSTNYGGTRQVMIMVR